MSIKRQWLGLNTDEDTVALGKGAADYINTRGNATQVETVGKLGQTRR